MTSTPTVARSEQDNLAAIAAARMSDADKGVLRRRFLAGEPEARFVVAALASAKAVA